MGWFAQIVTDEAVEVQDFRKSNYQCKGIYGIYLELIKKNQTITTRKPVGVKTLEFQLTQRKPTASRRWLGQNNPYTRSLKARLQSSNKE